MSKWWLRALYALTAIFVTWQENHLGHVGNFIISRTAAERLPLGENLYAPIVGQSEYLYSPTFAALFAPFALPPLVVGLLMWNLVNALALLAALERLLPERRTVAIALALTYLEMVNSLQNTQSNALVAGLVVLAFVAFESDAPVRAGLAIAAGTAIKIFPAAALVLTVFRRNRARWVLAFLATGLGAVALPLVVTSPATLSAQYGWWLQRTVALLGFASVSVMGILRSWFGYGGPAWPIQVAGTLLLGVPLALRRDRWEEPAFRCLFLCSLLVYMVIFNHNAESPSFVIAMTGIAVWYATARRTALHHVLIALVFFVLSVASERIVPDVVRTEWIRPYSLKAFVCLLCWLVMQRELLRRPAAPESPQAAPMAVAA